MTRQKGFNNSFTSASKSKKFRDRPDPNPNLHHQNLSLLDSCKWKISSRLQKLPTRPLSNLTSGKKDKNSQAHKCLNPTPLSQIISKCPSKTATFLLISISIIDLPHNFSLHKSGKQTSAKCPFTAAPPNKQTLKKNINLKIKLTQLIPLLFQENSLINCKNLC